VIIKITTGKSFKGAALYFLHDKREKGETERLTDDRVVWIDSFNTVQNDPERIIREMQATAMNQNWLRQQAGHTRGGNTTRNCVMSVSLSWHPEQKPDAEHMKAAARDFLERMGWGEHQALLVAHNDTAHRHVHIILNTIHPETGMTLDYNYSKVRAGKWRVEYERQHGKIYTREHANDASPHYGEWQAWTELQQDGRVDPLYMVELRSAEWRRLKENQKQERLDYFRQSGQARRELRQAIRAEVKAEFAPAWKAYCAARDQKKLEARRYDQEARRALKHYRRHGPLHGLQSVREIRQRQREYHQRIRDDLTEQRRAIHARMVERSVDLLYPALARLSQDRAQAYRTLLDRQRRERADLHRDQNQNVRRPDLLTPAPANQNAVLTPEQIKAYKDHANASALRDQQLEQTRRHVTGQPAPHPAAERRARTEQTERGRGRQRKDDQRDAQRQFTLAQALAQRRHDRETGGRESGGRER
jgi:hypothetical protein